ncbi:mucin-associated surface protein (MASP), partial [Trypanosoma cruzi]
MAMMMAGRVLLVCALCVLWCGAAAASSAAGREDVVTEEDEQTRTTEVLPSGGKNKSQVTSVEESTGKKAGNVKTPENSQAAILSTTNGPSDKKQEDEKKKKEKEGDTKDGEDEGKGEEEREKIEKPPTLPPPSGQTSTPTTNGNSAGTSNETRAKEMPSTDRDSTQEQVLKSPAAPTAATPKAKNENPGSADAVLVQQVQKVQSGLESGTESRKEESVLTKNKQQDGTFDSHAESTPTSRSSEKSVAASNGPDKATEDEISNKNTAGVDAVPEAAKDDGNKDDNKKETPIKTTDIANGTAPTGDSDSSTAVPHT